MGPFPALAPQRNSSILTGLIALLAGFALPLRASSRVSGWEFSRRKPRRSPPKTHSLRLIPASLLGFCKRLCSASLACHQGVARTPQSASVVPEPPGALPAILVHKPAHTDIHHYAQSQERK